ncbi:hypothetical protein D3C76_1660350 [compost metagenome]
MRQDFNNKGFQARVALFQEQKLRVNIGRKTDGHIGDRCLLSVARTRLGQRFGKGQIGFDIHYRRTVDQIQTA